VRIGPYGSHDDDFIRLLEPGKNVITINGYSHPAHWPGERTERLRAACDAGRTTLMAAGLAALRIAAMRRHRAALMTVSAPAAHHQAKVIM
jgi:hypothetical protein